MKASKNPRVGTLLLPAECEKLWILGVKQDCKNLRHLRGRKPCPLWSLEQRCIHCFTVGNCSKGQSFILDNVSEIWA
jgi:hypothetical protein